MHELRKEEMMLHLKMEGVEVVATVHAGLRPHRLRKSSVLPPQGVADLCGIG